MEEFSFKDRCSINTNKDADTFVGIKYDNGNIKVSFPLGFHLEDDDKGIRNDIFLLIRTISRFSDHKKSEIQADDYKYAEDKTFPMQAYLYIIEDFIEHGYYIETDRRFTRSKRGKINWPKTIKSQKVYVNDDNAVYLEFITNKNQSDEEKLITRIHEYCVYESYEKMGWLFTDIMPQKPRIKLQEKLFLSVLRNRLNSTFNDRNRRLFQNMISIIEWRADPNSATRFTYGTYVFEHIWEKMVDHSYGIRDKERFFPHTSWHITGREKPYPNASLIPDTIMLWDDNIFVLDSKYYKYGATLNPADLPESTSINKQITYAEYIAESDKYQKDGKKPVVYNAFILPYDAHSEKYDPEDNIRYIGFATGDWKLGNQIYERVQGILLDVKYLMMNNTEENSDDIKELAQMIKTAALYQC